MKIIPIYDETNSRKTNISIQNTKKCFNGFCSNIRINILKYLKFFLIIIINDLVLLITLRKEIKPYTDIILKNIQNIEKIQSNKNNNINIYDEFFYIPEVQKQIIMNNLNNIETISGGQGNVGNALIMLNNLINICEKIEYILYKDFNMNILSHYYAHKINIDIKL